MGRRSKIRTYPSELRKWLDAELVRRNFSDYRQLAADLVEQSKRIGHPTEVASKSGLQRYGAVLERRLQAIRDSTHAAAMIVDAAPDDDSRRAEALLALNETNLFDLMLAIREIEGETDLYKRAKLLSAITGNIAKLSRSSVYQKKHSIEIRAKVKTAADAAMRVAKKGGISKAGADELFRVITGIAA